jgi:tetratricopeptide (TPR) repeat protein
VARFELPTAPLHGNDSLVVVVADQRVGVLPVSAAGEVATLMLRAARLEADGRPTAAEAVYDTVLQADPDNVRALLGRGAVRSLAGKHQAARADFLSVLRADPDNAAALTGLGYSYARSGEYAKAEEQFQRALRASPEDDDAATGLAYAALWRYDPRQAVHRFDVLSAFRPTSYPTGAAAKFRAGVEHMRQGKLANAQYDFTAAIAAAPSWPDAYYNRALVYEAEGWPERARPDLEKYLQLRPAASNRDEIAAHVDALRIGNPGEVFKRGLIVPGLGQLSTGRPAVGLVVLAGVAGSAAWAMSTSTEMEERTFTDPFGQKYTDRVPVRRRPHVVQGVALAGAVWLLGAAEAYLHARHALGEGPELPESGGSTRRSSAAGARLLPVVSWRPSGPAFGAGITIPFR